MHLYVCVHVRVCTLSTVQLFANPWTAAQQAPLSMGFPRKNTGVGCRFLLQGIFPTPNPSIKPASLLSPALGRILYELCHLGS